MPELPEVETVRRQLDERMRSQTIRRVELLRTGREEPRGSAFVDALRGRTVMSVDRRAKLLVWKLDDGNALTAHLKMTGRYVFVEPDYIPGKHDRAIFFFDDATLVWSDIRQFGFMHLVDREELERILSAYGPEPLVTSAEELADRLTTPKTRLVKAALLDQATIAGIGNIYADESLHRAGIRPTRRLARVTADERLRLAHEVKMILAESLAQQGTSANDYVDTRGEKGGFLSLLRVYGREDEPCRTCQTPIKRIVLGQRGTHYCPTCQR